MSSEEAISRREQLRALVRVARYRLVFTAAIIGAGVFAAALEAVGLSFILPIVEIVQSPGDPAAEADGVLGVFVAAYRTLGIPFTLGSVVVGVRYLTAIRTNEANADNSSTKLYRSIQKRFIGSIWKNVLRRG